MARIESRLAGWRLRAVSATLLALGALVFAGAPARADVSINSFQVTPSVSTAGASPDVSIDARLSSSGSGGDTPQSLTLSLAPGLLANPSVATVCSASEFAAQSCPASSQVGDGTITGESPDFGSATVSIAIKMYLIQPDGSEVARIGVIVDFYDSPVTTVSAPVLVRTSPSVGIDIPMTGIPRQIQQPGGPVIPVQITDIALHLFGTVNGQPFTRNPTSCAPAATSISLASYDNPSTPVSASSSFTPTGCGSLSYHPQLSTAAVIDSADSGVAFTTTITQSPTDAATSTISMTLPSGLAPNLSLIAGACTATDLSTCPSIGTATVTTPLLGAPVGGQLVLVSSGSVLPTIEAVFPAPLALTLTGTPSLGATGLTASFSGVPDVPLSTLVVSFAGGSSSLLTATSDLCSGAQAVNALFTAQSGATASVSSPVSVSGTCPAAASQSSSRSGSGSGSGSRSGSASRSGKVLAQALTATVAGTGLTGKRPTFTVRLSEAAWSPALSRVTVRPPSGVTVLRRRFPHGISARVGSRPLAARSASLSSGVTLSLGKAGGHAVTVRLGAPTIRLSKSLLTKLRHHRKVKLTFAISVRDATGAQTTLRASLTVP